MNNEKPWWAPDAQGFLAAAIIAMTFTALIIRMFHSSIMEDKMLDTMITILFSTCLVTVYNYSFGSSRGSSENRESQNRVIEKLSVPPAPIVVPVTVPSNSTPITTENTTVKSENTTVETKS